MDKFEQFKLADKLHNVKNDISTFLEGVIYDEDTDVVDYFPYANPHLDIVTRINEKGLLSLITKKVQIPNDIEISVEEVPMSIPFQTNLQFLHLSIVYKDETLQKELEDYDWEKQTDCGELVEPMD